MLVAPTLPDLLRRAADEAPEAGAFRYRNERLTYRDWDTLAGRVAAALAARGVGRGDVEQTGAQGLTREVGEATAVRLRAEEKTTAFGLASSDQGGRESRRSRAA